MRHYHLKRNQSFCPTGNLGKLWTLVSEQTRINAAKNKAWLLLSLMWHDRLLQSSGEGKSPEAPVVVKGKFFSKRAEEKIKGVDALEEFNVIKFGNVIIMFTSFYKSHVHIRSYIGGLRLAGERCQVCGIPVWRQNQQIEEANGKVTSVSKIGITGFHLLSVGSNRADKHEGRKWCLTEIVSIVPSNRF
ncbi:hypothetical protein DBR06_SOUSAS19310004, partial [Sousa chinensis]